MARQSKSRAQDRKPSNLALEAAVLPVFEELENRLVFNSFTVLNTNDAGAGSLRQAVIDASSDGQSDTIGFDASLAGQSIILTSNDANANYGSTGLVVSNDSITIDGSNAPGLEISGNSARRIFALDSTSSLTLENITLDGGLAHGGNGGAGDGAGGGGAGLGGAVFNDGGSLTVQQATIQGSEAIGGNGATSGFLASGGGGGGMGGNGTGGSFGGAGVGGAPNGGTIISVNGGFGGGGAGGPTGGMGGFGGGGGAASALNGSGAAGSGGFGGGGATPSSNTTSTPGTGGFGGGDSSTGFPGAVGGGGAGLGGAIFNNAGTVTISDSTLTANVAQGGTGGHNGQGLGGAVFNLSGTISTANDTISSNAQSSGSDVFNYSPGTPATVTSTGHATAIVGTPFSFTFTTTGSPTAALSESGGLPAGLTFTDNHDGTATLSGTPASLSNTTYHLSVTAHNGIGSDAVQSFSLLVDAAPVGVSDSYTAIENTPLTKTLAAGVLANDTDADAADPLTAVVVAKPSHGTLALSAGRQLHLYADQRIRRSRQLHVQAQRRDRQREHGHGFDPGGRSPCRR